VSATYPKLIEERTGGGYYHQFVIQDAAGKRLKTPGALVAAKQPDGHKLDEVLGTFEVLINMQLQSAVTATS